MRILTAIFTLILLFSFQLQAQIDPALLRVSTKDTIKRILNMDAAFNRPLMDASKIPVSVGGYMEVNWQHIGTDGVSEGHQFQFRRLTLFVSSSISNRIKFLSEIEFEDGGKEIAVEFAALDVEFFPLLNVRGGVIVNPIGAFNENHDGPKWEFTDRPIAATQMLPATWSNAGFGLYGKHYSGDWMFGYEAYLSGNFDGSIIDNPENKTFLPSGKNNPDRFEELNSGLPLFTGKIAVKNINTGEIGLSYEGGIYNKFQDDGLQLDEKRGVNIFAVDFNGTIPLLNTYITGEFAFIKVEIPAEYTQQYGNKQHGGFIDLVQPVFKRRILNWVNATINMACRLEYVDWNVGRFEETGSVIGEDLWSIVPAISLRPTGQTVFRLNYRYQQQRDLLANPPARTGGFSFGLSTYF
jgi:hypothetical protein